MNDRYNSVFAKIIGALNKHPEGFAVTIGQTTYYSVSESLVSDHW